jgi:hypothetical protein
LKVTDVSSIDLEPRTTGISLAFGQTRQMGTPQAKTCKGNAASVAAFTWGTTNNQLIDISPSGNLCAGTWNRNSGGGIANYTICSYPNPAPNTGGLPYGSVYVTASADSVSSNPVEIFVHAAVTSVTLVGPQQCLSQGQLAQLDAQACYTTPVNGQPTNVLMCAPSTINSPSQYACPLPPGVSSVPNCTAAIGTLAYQVGTTSVASINSETNQITAEQPGTTVITAAIAGSGSSAGYFSTCPPQSISLTLANGETSGVISHGVTQNLVTTVTDTQSNVITGLTLDYQSTDPVDISVGGGGGITTPFTGVASITAICQPSTCNPSPINEVGFNGTGLSITSNPVTITTPGTASDYIWLAAPGQSQYFIPVELLTGTVGSTVRLPYVPNSMVVDKLGSALYFGSSRELMVFSTMNDTLARQDPNVPGVVLAVSPNDQQVLINDQERKVFYIESAIGGTISATFGGLGQAASWTPDSKTLYVSDSAALGGSHTDTLYVYNANTGWTTYPLPSSVGSLGAINMAVTTPSVGAYLSGSPTVAHTWCPSGIVGDYNSLSFYPQGDAVYLDPPADTQPVQTDVLTATTDGDHILGAALINGSVTLSDIGVTIPAGACKVREVEVTKGNPPQKVIEQELLPLEITHTLNQTQVSQVNATALNQVVPAPNSSIAFLTYNAPSSNTGAVLPYYLPVPGNTGTLGTIGYVPLTGQSAITAPLVGAFAPDDTLFFVSTAGDNMIHYIGIPAAVSPANPPVDTQQIAPNLPACTPISAGGTDAGCQFSGTGTVVPATAIAVKPRTTT